MSHWKQLTEIAGSRVEINMDHISYMRQDHEKTTLFFVGSYSETGKTRYLEVKETPEQILLAHPLRSF